MWKPCARSQSLCLSRFQSSGVSTPSATDTMPSFLAMSRLDSRISRLDSWRAACMTKDWSIFNSVKGMRVSCCIDEYPVP